MAYKIVYSKKMDLFSTEKVESDAYNEIIMVIRYNSIHIYKLNFVLKHREMESTTWNMYGKRTEWTRLNTINKHLVCYLPPWARSRENRKEWTYLSFSDHDVIIKVFKSIILQSELPWSLVFHISIGMLYR